MAAAHPIRAAAALLTGLALVACGNGGGTGEDGGELTLSGSSTVAPLATSIARRYEARNAGVQIDIQAGGSSRGIADAGRGTVNIGMSSRALHDDERERLDAHVIARDGVAVIVHTDNPVDAFTSEQVRDLFTGAIDNWQALGGPDRPVTVIHKSAGRATRAVFLEHFGIAAAEVRADSIVGSNQQGMQAVAGRPGAIGYVSIGHARQEIADGLTLRLATLDGVSATRTNVASGKFPISRPLVLVTPDGALSALAQSFIAFAQSPAVEDLVEDAGYVPTGG